jgi:sugar lactone lactonase YvrE
MLDTKLLRVENDATVVHADLSAHSGPQSNDMVIDATGRAYVSTIDLAAFAEMPATTLVRVDPDGSVSVAADGLLFPNGAVITPDGSALIVAESWGQRLTAFDIRPEVSHELRGRLRAPGSVDRRPDWREAAR